MSGETEAEKTDLAFGFEYFEWKETHISPREAPPVARAGEATKPAKNRKPRTVAIFLASAVGTWMITNKNNVAMYTGFRPIDGNS